MAEEKAFKKIFVALPTIGLMDSFIVHGFFDLVHDLAKMEEEGYRYIFAVIPRMLVAQARELAVSKALETNCDYLLFLDDDMTYPRHIVKRLLSHKKDIVGAVGFERLGDHNPNIYKIFEEKRDGEGSKETMSARWRNILDYKGLRDNDGLLEVDVIGFGCVLINMDVFKNENKIEEPWFMSQFQVGEDFFFCWKAKQKGYKIWADCHDAWLLGHLGEADIITEQTHIKKLKEKGLINESFTEA